MIHRDAEQPSRQDGLRVFEAGWRSHLDVAAESSRRLATAFALTVGAVRSTLDRGGKILLFGNGGSAADAQHIASELTTGYGAAGRPLAAIALTTDASSLTAIGNDLGFDRIFARQIAAIGRSGDSALALSTSGTSPNVLRALEAAREAGLTTIGWTGQGPHAMKPLCDVLIEVPSNLTPRIQEMHAVLGHILCDALQAPAP